MLTTRYKISALIVMTMVCALSLFDRGVITILLEPIKNDLKLSDSQLGFVTGIAFGLFYATLGVPIARWADRGNRVTIATFAMGLWGVTVMATALVGNFFQLVLARIAAAVGESGGQPPTFSLLGDYFPESRERMRAMYVYQAAGPITALGSFTLAGWLNDQLGWRMTFLIIGLPGLLLAVVVKLVLVEPRTLSPPRSAAPSLGMVFVALWRRRSCRNLLIAIMLIFTMSQGIGPWYGAYLIRSHGVTTTELGLWLGVICGIGGIASLFLGAWVMDRWFRGNAPAQMRFAGICIILAFPCLMAFLLLPHKHAALAALVPMTILITASLPAPMALLQQMVPDAMRATALMVMLMFANLVGMGLGPQIVGILSDILAPSLGAESLRYAMLSVSALLIWAGFHLYLAGRTVANDIVLAGADDAVIA